MKKTTHRTVPALCRLCNEPYLATLHPRTLVDVPAGGDRMGGRLTVFDGETYMVERHAPCTAAHRFGLPY
ncbi:hypothetical protein [Yinghuangia seranimata]|uniref:hypothetical protein n=1 Tax=Yinghuangia seranimata TaxID=408067 RepID=UPI00248C4FF6|nr:hypothetical protein [Yinghuangia seranimata]MDI2132581.1 hypothetical protein [Yinghuangia seranimata]